jgi:hypothetical protein
MCGVGIVAQALEHLPSKHEALNSNPSDITKIKNANVQTESQEKKVNMLSHPYLCETFLRVAP